MTPITFLLQRTLLTIGFYAVVSVCILSPLVTEAARMMPLPQDVSLTVTPQSPAANSAATVSLSAFGNDTSDVTIEWQIDGAPRPGLKNERSITVGTGNPGSVTKIDALVRARGISARKLSRVITPVSVDVIVEPDSYVPARFSGRALPSAGSAIRLVAVPHFFTNGVPVPSDAIAYDWSVNGNSIYGGAAMGKNVTTFTMPTIGNPQISLVATTRGGLYARSDMTLRITKPIVSFYENSTLYGTILQSFEKFLVPKDEIVVNAEPYYLPRASLIPGALSYTWTVDGKQTTNPSTDPRTITLRKIEAGVAAKIGFSFVSTGESLDYGGDTFTVDFTDPSVLPL